MTNKNSKPRNLGPQRTQLTWFHPSCFTLGCFVPWLKMFEKPPKFSTFFGRATCFFFIKAFRRSRNFMIFPTNKSSKPLKKAGTPPLNSFFCNKKFSLWVFLFLKFTLIYLVEEDFWPIFTCAWFFPNKLACNPTRKKHPPFLTLPQKNRGVYSAASGEDIVTFNSSSSNGDIVPDTVRALKGHLCELLGYNRFRQTLLTSDGVAQTREKLCKVFLFWMGLTWDEEIKLRLYFLSRHVYDFIFLGMID